MNHSPSKKWPLKTRKSQRHDTYYGFVKSRVATRTLPGVRGYRFGAACCAKMVPNACLFENPENCKGHPKTTFYKRKCWHWDLLKTVPRSGLETNKNNNGELLETMIDRGKRKKLSRTSLYEEFTLPSIQQKYENLQQNWSHKASKIVQNRPLWRSGSIYWWS